MESCPCLLDGFAAGFAAGILATVALATAISLIRWVANRLVPIGD